ncbi:MAG: B12-binding domain-containing radical SAM protein [Bdellovibrionaceae bacterium]|nr:B12-binding domain-containing radical SAM protein [Pseudobdellovibrionaceae bacterium]NUM58852.1 DUF4080 domain-containing protein [Pseudobdellovibrionaceae bacterium]
MDLIIKDLILLVAVNSTYQHAAFGLRYLKANLNELTSQCVIKEFTIAQEAKDIAEQILKMNPRIIGIGVYIWNTELVLEILQIIRKVTPEKVIVLGGPEISYETHTQPHIHFADYIIPGEADLSFYRLCKKILSTKSDNIVSNENFPPDVKKLASILPVEIPEISQIQLPYNLYTTEDVKNRVIYVEASRGCPYKCEYCLSSLDKSVRNFNLELFLKAMEDLLAKGVKEFKFVDRTFNLSPNISQNILHFFLQNIDKNLFLHFELVPDRLPEELKSLIKQFPAGSLQFEVGIQTLNDNVSKNVSRRQNVEKIKDNFKYLRNETHVHTHADLIVGLPGETLESFKVGFDELFSMGPDEIQVGILKRLKGTPIIRHDQEFQMKYSDNSPFQILQNKHLSFYEVQKMVRFSKFWDMIANSGNWKTFVEQLKIHTNKNNQSFFQNFMLLTHFLQTRHGLSHGISLIHLAESIFIYMNEELKWSTDLAIEVLIDDYCLRKRRDLPPFIKNSIYKNQALERISLAARPSSTLCDDKTTNSGIKSVKKRQLQHL